jgi:hypothetical protein
MNARRHNRFRIGLPIAVLSCLLCLSCSPGATPIARALDYLDAHQVRAPCKCFLDGRWVVDYTGNWPQHFYMEGLPEIRVPEVSPFMVSFIHHALALVNPGTRGHLGLSTVETDTAYRMRKRAITFMRRFESSFFDPDAGTYGFWPYDETPDGTFNPLVDLELGELVGPLLEGNRSPINLAFYPDVLAIPSDADDTATVHAARLTDMRLDGGPEANWNLARFFEDWRDTGDTPRRLNPWWLPNPSGVFFTWLNYGEPDTVNDIDLVVNANVLYALGRFGLLGTPGVQDAVALINSATLEGLHRNHHEDITDYYPDNFAYHYCVSRAYHEGAVEGLQPAVDDLVDDLEILAIPREDGTVYWDKGSPHLNTAFAVLTLLNGRSDSPLIEKGINYLLAEQDPVLGCWDEGVFFIGRVEGSYQFNWVSPSFTTAIAVEALCRYRLAVAECEL